MNAGPMERNFGIRSDADSTLLPLSESELPSSSASTKEVHVATQIEMNRYFMSLDLYGFSELFWTSIGRADTTATAPSATVLAE